jgi:hypothetical protein
VSKTLVPVNSVYADEVDCPEGEESVAWMLLTSEVVMTIEDARQILHWYSYWLTKLNGKSQVDSEGWSISWSLLVMLDVADNGVKCYCDLNSSIVNNFSNLSFCL